MSSNTPTPTPKVLHVDEIDPIVRANAYGDGATAEERFQRGLAPYVSAERLLQLTLEVRNEMQRQVEAGELIPVVSARGVVGWHTTRR